MFLRVVMVTTLLLIAIYVEAVSETLLKINTLYHLIVATYLLTIVHILALRFVRHLGAQVYAQVILDLLVITGLVYLTGGESAARGGFLLLYPLSVLSGSVLLDRRQGILLAGVATIFYASLLWAVRERWILPQGLVDVPFVPVKHVLYSIFLTGVACVTVAMVGGYFAQSLKTVGAQLNEVSEQVADLQQLNELIVESMQSGLMMVDAGGRVLYVNRYGESVLGRATSELRGASVREIFASHAFDPAVIGTYSRGIAGRLETTYARAGGAGTLDLGVSVMPLAQGGGYLLVFQDLTDIKRLERDVRVKEKLAAVGEMAAQLAHEIRNPLGAISGSAQVLMSEANMDGEQARLLAIITRESKRLSDALNQYLVQARPGPFTAGPVDLGPLIGEAVALLKNGPEVGPRHHIEFERDKGPHVCAADPDRILQIFWNLARNGLEAMPGGGGLHIRLTRRNEAVVLSVRDDGTGIAGDDPRRLFEPLHAPSRAGAGLGLAIVYGIVKEHRGDLRVRSVPGQGTEFEVHLPLMPVTAGVAKEA